MRKNKLEGKIPGSGRKAKKKKTKISIVVNEVAFNIYEAKDSKEKGPFLSKAIINQDRADKKKIKLKDDGK